MHVVDSNRPGDLRSLGCGLREVWRREAGANRCRRVAEDRLPVCRACRERLRRELTELPELYRTCESLLVRYPRAFAQRLAGSPAAGLSLHEPATNARRDIVAVLASWCALVADERLGVARPGCRDVSVLAAFLTAHVDWLLAHPAGSCFAEELVAVAAAAREVSRTGPAPALPDVELGQCVEEGCDNNMIAARSADGRSSSVEVRCAAGHVWQAGQWLQLAGQLKGRSRMSA